MSKKDPSFSFQREEHRLHVSFNNSPLGENKWVSFTRVCASDLEAELLKQHMSDFLYEIRKQSFNEGYDAHKKRQPNYYK